MHRLAVTVPLLVVVLGSQMSPVARADDPAQVLKRRGLKSEKGKYILAAEEDVWRSRIQALTDLDAADAAIAEAGAAAARNQRSSLTGIASRSTAASLPRCAS
jgi:hypothetical protein